MTMGQDISDTMFKMMFNTIQLIRQFNNQGEKFFDIMMGKEENAFNLYFSSFSHNIYVLLEDTFIY